jgi:hypothetical protein
MAVAIDANGQYVVLDGSGDIVDEIHVASKLIRVSPQGQATVLHTGVPLRFPTDIAIDAEGNYVIADRGTAGRVYGLGTVLPENGAVYRYLPATGEFVTVRSSVDQNGNARMDDLLGHVASVAIDGQGNYVVLEAPTHCDNRTCTEWEFPVDEGWITRMRPNGEILQVFRVPDLEDKISMPLGLVIDSHGDYIIADAVGVTTGSGRILRMTPDGQFSIVLSSNLLGAPKDLVLLPRADGVGQHRADFQPPYWRIDLTEVNRVLAYWRSGAYHINPEGADGYAPGPGNTEGTRHTADYQAPFWQIDATEVNRVLAYWRAGGFHADPEGTDGFAPGQ